MTLIMSVASPTTIPHYHKAPKSSTMPVRRLWHKKADIALPGENPMHLRAIRDVTCYMGSHSVTCHQTQVNAPRLTSAIQAGTRFTYPGGMEG